MATVFSKKIIADVINASKITGRRRLHRNLHSNYDSSCQVLLNCIQTDSYIRPHRHFKADKDEYLFALQGFFALITFNEYGVVSASTTFGSKSYLHLCDANWGVKIEPTEWHTVLALASNSVLLEIKEGPFVQTEAKEYASWSPSEGACGSSLWLEGLRQLVVDLETEKCS